MKSSVFLVGIDSVTVEVREMQQGWRSVKEYWAHDQKVATYTFQNTPRQSTERFQGL